MLVTWLLAILMMFTRAWSAAPHNDTSGFSSACNTSASAVGLLSEHVKPFSPYEAFDKESKRELLVISANSGVMPLVLNLLKSIKSLDLEPGASDEGRQLRFLVVVFTEETLSLCDMLHIPCYHPRKAFQVLGLMHLGSNYAQYGSDNFKRITLSLTHIIGWFLREGWTVFNTDVDIAWLRSPYKQPHSILSYGNDIAIGGNNRPYFNKDSDINTGYYRVRPSEWSSIFFEKMFHECKESNVDDQDCMKKKLKAGGDRSMAHVTFLNSTDYPISACVWRKMKEEDKKQRAHLFHAACMNGMAEKLGFMNDNGMLLCPRLRKAWMDVERKIPYPSSEDGAKALGTALEDMRAYMEETKTPKTLAGVLKIC